MVSKLMHISRHTIVGICNYNNDIVINYKMKYIGVAKYCKGVFHSLFLIDVFVFEYK